MLCVYHTMIITPRKTHDENFNEVYSFYHQFQQNKCMYSQPFARNYPQRATICGIFSVLGSLYLHSLSNIDTSPRNRNFIYLEFLCYANLYYEFPRRILPMPHLPNLFCSLVLMWGRKLVQRDREI